jgi:membrane protein
MDMSFSLRPVWARLLRLSGRDLWERDVEDFGVVRRTLITALRIAAVVWRGFNRHQLTTRAGSLTYVTMFSLVPTLAVALAMFSAFGGLANARQVVLGKVMDYLAVGVREEVSGWLDRMLSNISGSAIGATGLVFVIVAVFTLLSSVEDVFNDIWGVKRTRGYLERLTLYWTVITVSPTLIVLGMSLPEVVLHILPLQWLLEGTGARTLTVGIVPWLFVVGGFAALYMLLTARRIPLGAAAAGGIVGGTMWFAAAGAYGWYARSTAYYANIYGSLAAIPIFIFWLYLSWLLVFIGAQVAFAWQNLDTYREEILSTAPSQISREQLVLRVIAETAQRWVAGTAPATAQALAADLHTSARAVNEAVGCLVELGLLADHGADGQLLLTRDPRQLTSAAVLRALREQGQEIAPGRRDHTMARIRDAYARATDAAEASWHDLTVADLAGDDEPHAATGEAARRHAPRPARTGR